MRYELHLARGLMALALIVGAGSLAAFAPAAPNPTAHPAVVCPTPAATRSVNPIEGVAGMMAPGWRTHLPALIGRRPA